MTKTQSLYEFPLCHPFRGAIRTIDEIAEMTGRPAHQIRRFIKTGVTIPLSRQLIAEDRLEGKKRSKRASARGVGNPGKVITIEGHRYPTIAIAAAAIGKSLAFLSRRVQVHGTTLKAEQLVCRKKRILKPKE